MTDNAFPQADREAVYRAIAERRDMRHFRGGSVAPELLQRLLHAAHQAPSVGLMQPWRFIRISDRPLRGQIQQLVEEERVRTAEALGERSDEFMKLKVQGVLDAAEVLVVAMPPGREAHIFGRRTLPEMDIASAACAIQNLWLAVRADLSNSGQRAKSTAMRSASSSRKRPTPTLCTRWRDMPAFAPRVSSVSRRPSPHMGIS